MFSFLARPRQPAAMRRRSRELNRSEHDDPVAACGWFDSSHDLRHGLQAIELSSDDALPVALALEICVVL